MRKMTQKLLFTVFFIGIMAFIIASSFIRVLAETDSNGIWYGYNSDGDSYSVVGIKNATVADLVIPSTYEGKPVTAIQDNAFRGLGFRSVEIPDSITSIGEYAFADCTALTSIEIPDSVKSIGFGAFENCSNMTSITLPFVGGELNATKNTSLGYIFGTSAHYSINSKLPASLKSVVITGGNTIPEQAFAHATGLTHITLGNGVTSIGEHAFWECTSLISITIPDSVQSIEKGAFWQCTSLNSITIPDSVTNIPPYMFSGCTNLTSIEFSDNVTNIGGYAFENCKSLLSIRIPDGIPKIGTGTFYGCDALTSIEIPDSVTSIEDIVFNNCVRLESVKIGSGVTGINDRTFENCVSLKHIIVDPSNTAYQDIDGNLYTKGGTLVRYAMGKSDTTFIIPEEVNYIGRYAFSGCEQLIRIDMPHTVQYIDYYAFTGCRGLTSIELSENLKAIGPNAFEYCASLTEITIGEDNTQYKSMDGILYSKDGKKLVIYAPGKKDARFEIPENVTSIGEYAFRTCEGIKSITIRSGIKVGRDAFWECIGLTDLTIESGTYIGKYAFAGCTALTKIEIPYDTTLGDTVFSGCDAVQSVTMPSADSGFKHLFGSEYVLPETLTTVVFTGGSIIDYDCFEGCSYLTDIVLPDTITSIDSATFNGCISLINIIIGENNATYRSIDGNLYTKDGKTILRYALGKPSQHMQIPDSVEVIGDYAFHGCVNMTSIEIPESVGSIGDYAFSNCVNITSIEIPASVRSIGTFAFYDCDSLTSVTIANGVKSIEEYAFYSCGALLNIRIPDSVESIGDCAFEGCVSMASISLPSVDEGFRNMFGVNIPSWLKNVEIRGGDSIPAGTFKGFRDLTGVVIMNGVTSIGDEAFHNCESLTSIEIPDSVTSIGIRAFYSCNDMKSIIIGSGVESIGESAFGGCSIENLYISDIVAWCKIEFSNYESNPLNATYLSSNFYLNGTLLTNLVIPDSVTTIHAFAFYNFKGLTDVTIGSSVTSIGERAFGCCYSLRNVTFLSETPVESVSAFYDCYRLQNIYVPCESFAAYQTALADESAKLKGWGHIFNQEKTDTKFLKSEATCVEKAVYYKSCLCGEKGSESFVYGTALGHTGGTATCEEAAVCIRCRTPYEEALGHKFVQQNIDTQYLKSAATCTEKAVYYKSCICGLRSNETFEYGEVLEHQYNRLSESSQYLKSAATCTEKAVYYKSCICGLKGTETFEGREMLDHSYDQENTAEQFLKDGATCTKSATYYYSCVCGNIGGKTFQFGNPLGHTGGEATCTERAVCERCLTSYGQPLGHIGGEATCTERAVCERCRISYGQMLEHKYDQRCAEESYLKSAATCTEKAVYYKSCICGLKGSETFEYGDALGHHYDQKYPAPEYLKSAATCTEKAVYYKSCICGLKGTETFEYGDILGHSYDQENPDEQFLKDNATCTKSATYYYSCVCGDVGVKTFQFGNSLGHTGGEATCTERAVCERCLIPYGQMLEHKYEQRCTEESYLKSAATCTEKAVYYKSCVCGLRSNETFEYGETLDHSYDQENPNEQFLKDNATCTKSATYYYSCVCGDVGVKTFQYGTALGHTGGEATCTEKAVCERCSMSYGKALGHRYEQLCAEETYLKSAATCTENAVYYKSCICGLRGNETFEYGDALGHKDEDLNHSCDRHCGKSNMGNHADGEDKDHLCDYGCGNVADGGCYDTVMDGKCDECGAEIVHECLGGNATCESKAECEICGREYGNFADHVPNADDHDCTTPIMCSLCGQMISLGRESHTGGTATCNVQARCEVCQKEYGGLAAHEDNDSDCKCDDCDYTMATSEPSLSADVLSTEMTTSATVDEEEERGCNATINSAYALLGVLGVLGFVFGAKKREKTNL